MLKVIIFLMLVSTNLWAATPLLDRHVTSGFVDEEDSFVKDCVIFQDRYLRITKQEGTAAPQTHTHRVSRQRIRLIQSLLHIAHDGEIEDGNPQCDGGDQLLYGYHDGEKFIIEENFDCGDSKENTSRAAMRLKLLVKQMCGF